MNNSPVRNSSSSPRAGQNRVLFVSPSSYLLSGLASWLDYLLPGLRALGWDVTLGLVEGPRYHRPSAYLREHPDQQWVSIPCNTGTHAGRIHALRKVIRKTQPHVIASINIPHAIIAMAFERMAGNEGRALITCHGIQADLYQDMLALGDVADAVACTNRLACALAESESGWSSDRIFHAPCGAPVRSFSPTQRDEIFTVAYVGRLEQQQKRVLDLPGILRCLEARGVPVRMLIAGTGPEEKRLREDFGDFVARGQVEFLGHVHSADLSTNVYQRADALVVSSSWETGPIVVWEAMGEGVPVVSSRYLGSGCEAALVHEQNCLMFETGHVESAAENIERLVVDQVLRERIARNGWMLARDEYSHDASTRKWGDALQAVLELPSRPRRSDFQLAEDNGRLDQVLGGAHAERVRRVFRMRGPDSGPAGEWPHTLPGRARHSDRFWEIARSHDERARTDATSTR